jgi:hypothetical protein
MPKVKTSKGRISKEKDEIYIFLSLLSIFFLSMFLLSALFRLTCLSLPSLFLRIHTDKKQKKNEQEISTLPHIHTYEKCLNGKRARRNEKNHVYARKNASLFSFHTFFSMREKYSEGLA